MKKLLINEENKEAIMEMITSKRGKETSRLVTWLDIQTALVFAEKKASRLMKKHLKDFKYFESLNEKMPNSYKYSYEADTFTIAWTKKGWVFESFIRDRFYPNQPNLSKFYWDVKDPEKLTQLKSEVKEFLLDGFLG